MVADGDGDFHVTWMQLASTYQTDIRYPQVTPETGWAAASTISVSRITTRTAIPP